MGTHLYLKQVIVEPVTYEQLLENCQQTVIRANRISEIKFNFPTKLTYNTLYNNYYDDDLSFLIVDKRSGIYKFSQQITIGKRTANIIFYKNIELKYFISVKPYSNYITTKKHLERVLNTKYDYPFFSKEEQLDFDINCKEHFLSVFNENTMFGYTG